MSELRIGIEDTQLFRDDDATASEILDWSADNGFDGVGFKLVTSLDAELDSGALAEVAAHARARGQYLELGIGSINPANLPETPWVRDLGDGDVVAGLARMVRAAAEIGCHELLATTAHWKGQYAGRWTFDRFRTDLLWPDQLAMTARLLERLAPVLRDCGSRICIETHEEIASFEVLSLVESAGAEVACVAFDVGNVICRGEDPLAAAARVAPHLALTHVKDAILVPAVHGDGGHGTTVPEGSYTRWIRPIGEGIVDWSAMLTVLGRSAVGDGLRLTLEDNQNPKLLEFGDPDWRAAHPDLSDGELAVLVGRASPGPVNDASLPRWTREDRLARLTASRDALRAVAAGL